jgi:hypothetical protein
MPNLSQNSVSVSVFESWDSNIHGLGAKGETADGRKFRWAKAGASALVVGDMLQAPAADTDHDDITVRATAAGSTELLITTGSGAGALDANEYAGGYAIIDTTPGLGYMYKISSHAAIAASTNGSIFLDPADPIQVALTTSSKVTLIKNQYDGVIQTPVTTLTGSAVGAAVYPIAAGEYGWIQTGGTCGVLTAGTPIVGSAVVVPGTAAGCVVADGAAAATQVVGSMRIVGRDGKVCPVYLTLD